MIGTGRKRRIHCRCCGYGPTTYLTRGICHRCRKNPDLFARYAPLTNTGVRSPCPSASRGPIPAEPTAARPGSAEKVAVMEARALAGECLFHPDDARAPE